MSLVKLIRTRIKMPLFEYYFLTDLKKKRKGSIEASSLKEAKERLWEQQICVLKVIPKKTRKIFVRNKINSASLIKFSRQVCLLLRSGMPLYESLLLILEQYKSTFWEPIISFLSEKIRQGLSLSEGLAKFPEIFADFYRAMIISGETIGKIEEAFENNIYFLEKEEKFKKQLLSSLTYPCILFCFSLLVIGSFLLFVIPSLKTVFQDFSVNWVTKLVFSISDVVCSYIHIFLVSSIFFIGGCVLLFKQDKVRIYCEKIFLSIPILRGFLIKLAVGKFSRLLGILLKGEVPIVEALKISKKGIYPKIFQTWIDEVEAEVITGSSLSKELKKHSIFPKLLVEMVSFGEEAGHLDLVFSQVADIYEEDTRRFLNNLVTWAQPMILIILGGFIGFIMLAVLIPFTDYSLVSF